MMWNNRVARIAVPLAFALALLPPPRPAEATTSDVTVNDTRDSSDPSPNIGGCESNLGTCTLRAAIQRANNRSKIGFNQHVIRLPPGTYTITIPGRDEND